MNKDSLIEELKPFYQEGDCCSFIVELRKKCSVKDKEIERLNNIINELEKFIKEEYEYCDKIKNPAYGVGMGVSTRILRKLQELKGDGSNE